MPSILVTERKFGLKYDGTNSAEFDAIQFVSVVSEFGGVLTLDDGGTIYNINVGEWALHSQGHLSVVFSESVFFFFFTQLVSSGVDLDALADKVEDLEDALDTLGGDAVRAVGVGTAPTLLLNTPVNVDVRLTPTMPDTSYTPYSYVFGGVSLTSITINSTTVLSADTVRVNLQTSLVSLAGVHVLVTAKD